MLKKIKILIIITIVFILSLFLIKHFNIGIPCLYYEMTGLYCPGCGITRAILSILELEFYQAIRYNAFSLIIVILIGLYVIGGVYGWLFNKPNFMDNKIPPAIWIIFMAAMLLYGILRNTSQFAFLAPTII